ncbi:MAG: ABC transporter ATP-binding protein [Bacteroidota bacterium]
MQPVLTIEHLSKTFGKNHVLRDINLQLHRGQSIAILGKSGIGKSVLAKCIVRLFEPDAGAITIFGKDLLKASDAELAFFRQKVGYLFQSSALYDSMSVRENLEFALRYAPFVKNHNHVDELVLEALTNVGLEDTLDQMPAELSGGMRKRLGLARTLITKPEIILYDEPTTGLDPVTSREISELILALQKKYATAALIITHDLACVATTADNVKLLHKGIFYAEGTFTELANSSDPVIRSFFRYDEKRWE